MASHTKKKSSSDVIAGGLSGLICGIIFQPLEVIKVNMIIQPKGFEKYKIKSFFGNFSQIAKTMYEREGLRSFWRGTTANVLRSSGSAAIYFHTLRKLDMLTESQGKARYDFINSALARTTTAVITNPLTIIRTRAEIIGHDEYRNFFRACRLIYQKEGLRAFKKGGLLLILEEFPFGGIFNLSYEFINRKMGNHTRDSKLGFLLSGMISGAIATTLTHPFEICRTKIQSHKVDYSRKYRNSIILSILVDTYERYGYLGLAKGLLPRLLKKTLVNASTFYLYELFRNRTFH